MSRIFHQAAQALGVFSFPPRVCDRLIAPRPGAGSPWPSAGPSSSSSSIRECLSAPRGPPGWAQSAEAAACLQWEGANWPSGRAAPHLPAARLGRERGGDLQLRKTSRKASICHFLGGKDSEESCLSLLADAGSCGEMVAHRFASNSLFPSLIPPSSIQTQTHRTPFLLPSTACLSQRILFS